MAETEKKYVGGQAVIEGVMMRGETMYAMAVRNTVTKEINIDEKYLKNPAGKRGMRKWPIFRGVFAFVDSLVVGMKLITRSMEMSGMLEEEDAGKDKPPKDEKTRQKEKEKEKKQTDALLYGSVALSLVFAVGLFMMLPTWIGSRFNGLLGGNTWALGIVEGLVRLAIFLIYVCLISLMPDIKRVYRYHGAEHKTINCYESGDALTVENVRNRSRLHKRCGTSFLLIVMIISMIFFLFVRTQNVPLRILSRVIFVPLIAGLSYEVIRWAGRHDNAFVSIVSFPGMCVQRVTTADPDDSMIETAIAAMNAVLDAETGKTKPTETHEPPDA